MENSPNYNQKNLVNCLIRPAMSCVWSIIPSVFPLFPVALFQRIVEEDDLKRSLTEDYSPQRHRGRWVYCLICFPLTPVKWTSYLTGQGGRKTNNNKPYPMHLFYSKVCSFVTSYYFDWHNAVDLFFSGVHAPLNSADHLSGVSRKEKLFFLRELCVSSEVPTSGQAGRWKTFSHLPAKQSWDHPAMREGLRD